MERVMSGASWWEEANRKPVAWFYERARAEQSRMISADDDARLRGQGMAIPRLTKAQRARKERDV
jgi:hypothetical protein